ncbi:hypothetical protein [Streptomyces erythrochromogenes]|uniref:hypothetical protein n=1 Tax=Streptomyces erythrochromogenes TaxID=285574 RepID=UPI0036B68729
MNDLPPAHAAYINAPHVQEETEELMRLRRAGRIGERDWLLRHAALTDRQTLGADPADGKVQTAVRTSVDKLIAFDTASGTTAGPLATDNPAWSTDPCGYVRQEYAIWATGNVRP